MPTCEPCGENGNHLPHCDHSALESQVILARQLSADIHADRKLVMADRDNAKAEWCGWQERAVFAERDRDALADQVAVLRGTLEDQARCWDIRKIREALANQNPAAAARFMAADRVAQEMSNRREGQRPMDAGKLYDLVKDYDEACR